MILDVSQLTDFSVDTATKMTTFGTGFNGQSLYWALDPYGLSVPGGAALAVGVGGLWHGCGRGPWSNHHGLACDAIRAVEYVDASGELQVALTSRSTIVPYCHTASADALCRASCRWRTPRTTPTCCGWPRAAAASSPAS